MRAATKAWGKNRDKARAVFGDIGDWDVSNVTNMSFLFKGVPKIIGDLSKWNVRKVEKASMMFAGVTEYNGKSAKDMIKALVNWSNQSYFHVQYHKLTNEELRTGVKDWVADKLSAEIFYGHIKHWNTSLVTSMSRLFVGSREFDEDLSEWDMTKVLSVKGMFAGHKNLVKGKKECPIKKGPVRPYDTFTNEQLAAAVEDWVYTAKDIHASKYDPGVDWYYGHISGWDVKGVTDMSKVFKGARFFNDDISKWDVSRVKSMTGMFDGAAAFDQELGTWNVSSVTDMSYMFRCASKFSRCISKWEVSNVENMAHMFCEAYAFDVDISKWDVSRCKNMDSMFRGARIFNKTLPEWDVSKVEKMPCMFYEAFAFNGDIRAWDVSQVRDMKSMFCKATRFHQDIRDWNVCKVQNTQEEMDSIFLDAPAFCKDYKDFIDKWQDKRTLRDGKFTTFGLKRAVNQWKYDRSNIERTYGKMKDWDVSEVEDMSWLFINMASFDEDISGWDVSRVENMCGMFQGCSSFDCDVTMWNLEKVRDMEKMFAGAKKFTGSHKKLGACWDLSKVENAKAIFLDTPSLKEKKMTTTRRKVTFSDKKLKQATAEWVEDATSAEALYGPISAWKVCDVTDMSFLLKDAAFFNEDLSKWDVSNVKNMEVRVKCIGRHHR